MKSYLVYLAKKDYQQFIAQLFSLCETVSFSVRHTAVLNRLEQQFLNRCLWNFALTTDTWADEEIFSSYDLQITDELVADFQQRYPTFESLLADQIFQDWTFRLNDADVFSLVTAEKIGILNTTTHQMLAPLSAFKHVSYTKTFFAD